MSHIRSLQRSFGGGEISLEMAGHFEDPRYQSGVAMARNFIIRPQGPAVKRPGFAYVNEVRDSSKKARLIPFTFNTTQTCVIEIGPVGSGGDLSASMSSTSYATDDWLTLPNTTDMTKIYARQAVMVTADNTDFKTGTLYYVVAKSGYLIKLSLTVDGGAIPTTANNSSGKLVPAGYFRFHSNGSTIKNAGVSSPYETAHFYTEDELFDVHFVQSNDVMTMVHPNHPPMELRRYGTTDWRFVTSLISSPIAAPATPTLAEHQPFSATADPNTIPYNYVVTAVAADGISESAASPSAGMYSQLDQTGRFITISWTSVTGASRYNVYKLEGGVYGYIGNTFATSINDDGISPDLSKTPPIYDNIFGVAGSIQSVAVTNGGSGYMSTAAAIQTINYYYDPNSYIYNSLGSSSVTLLVKIGDRAGTGASATATGVFIVTSPGSGSTHIYNYQLTSVTLTAGGHGYVDPYLYLADSSGNWIKDISASFTIYPNTVTLKVTDSAGQGSGASLTAVTSGGAVIAVNVVNGGSGYVSPVVTVDFAAGGSGAVFGTPVMQVTGDYPGAVGYYEQRKSFAGTTRKPANLWMTRSGTENTMAYSLPIRDDDRIAFRIAAREASTINHIVPLSQLMLLTSSAEWRVTSVNSDAITPTSISVKPQSYIGSNNVQPVIVNNSMVFCAARGGHVRECGYDWQSQGFVTGDLSLRSAHLFDGMTITDMCYSKAPFPIIWMVSSSGKLLGITYVPEEKVGAWHQHDTDGSFESCAAVAEGNEDILYAVVNRTINGVTRRYVERMSEQIASDSVNTIYSDSAIVAKSPILSSSSDYVYDPSSGVNAIQIVGPTGSLTGPWTAGYQLQIWFNQNYVYYSDNSALNLVFNVQDSSGTTYHLRVVGLVSVATEITPGEYIYNPTGDLMVQCDQDIPTSLHYPNSILTWTVTSATAGQINGLSTLEGKSVSVLGDGVVQTQQTVASGAITPSALAAKYVIGLPYTADLQTLPAAMQVDGAFGIGRVKNINKSWLRLYRSSSISVGPDLSNLRTEPAPSSADLEEVEVTLTPQWQQLGQVFVRHTDPLPVEVLSISYEVALGG